MHFGFTGNEKLKKKEKIKRNCFVDICSIIYVDKSHPNVLYQWWEMFISIFCRRHGRYRFEFRINLISGEWKPPTHTRIVCLFTMERWMFNREKQKYTELEIHPKHKWNEVKCTCISTTYSYMRTQSKRKMTE